MENEGSPTEGSAPVVVESFDDWVATQADEIKAAYETHITGLKNTVTATREERDALTKQLREAAKEAEKGSAAEKQLTELAERLEASEKKSVFLEEALKNECRNPKAAWALATADDLFTKSGKPDWAAIKEAGPELFGKASAEANPGSGTSNEPQGSINVNDWVRQQVAAKTLK